MNMKTIKHNPLATVFSVGINDIKGGSKLPSYRRWVHILERCYCPISLGKHPTYHAKVVNPDWFLFSNFNKWYEQKAALLAQYGFNIETLSLDSDLKQSPSDWAYSSDNCVFIPKSLNSKLANLDNNVEHCNGGKYRVRCTDRLTGKRKTVYCNSSSDAYELRCLILSESIAFDLEKHGELLKLQCIYSELYHLTQPMSIEINNNISQMVRDASIY